MGGLLMAAKTDSDGKGPCWGAITSKLEAFDEFDLSCNLQR